jgi:hypothetical protein
VATHRTCEGWLGCYMLVMCMHAFAILGTAMWGCPTRVGEVDLPMYVGMSVCMCV